MATESDLSGAALRLRRAFAGVLALERASRAFEALALGASCAWVLAGLARLAGEQAARDASAPAALAGLFAAASWLVERWRAPREIAQRADRTLATPQLLDTALGAPRSTPPAWSELLARRALERFDRTRLWLAAAPAWAATAAVLLGAVGARALLERCAPVVSETSALAQAWSALAEGLESGASRAAPARAELAAELQAAARREARGELAAQEARALLERAAQELSSAASGSGGAATAPLAALEQVYGGSEPGVAASGGGGGRAPAGGSSGGGSGVPSGAGDGTMGGSADGGSTQLPAPPGSAGGAAAGAVRPTLSARWWPRDQDGLVEAWIERQQRTRSKR